MDRHKVRRTPYRSRSLLRLFSDVPESPEALLYTRSISPQGVGFLSDRPLTLSHGGTVRIALPEGDALEIGCTVLRCRQVAPGWYEGALYFNRQQPKFAAEVLKDLDQD